MSLPNARRGETALGKHKLKVTFNGWCTLEALLGERMPGPVERMQRGLGFSELRSYVRAFLVKDLDDKAVGELIDEVGFPETLRALAEACEGFFPDASKEGAEENPLKAA